MSPMGMMVESRRLDQMMGGLVAALIVMAILNPSGLRSLSPGCLWSKWFHVQHCWGCGMTRACIALLHGQFAQAIEFNPMVLIVAPLLAFLYARWLWRSFFPNREGLTVRINI